MIRALTLTLLLAGCASSATGYGPYGASTYGGVAYGVPDAVVVTRPPELYTRAEIDAINAETQCRSLARNTLQAQRCGIRR
jgi:hypothetical protein